MKNQKGITLVAIIVTIIIMIILAGISITIAIDENGILDNSIKAVEKTELAEEKDFIMETWAYVLTNCEDITLITPVIDTEFADNVELTNFLKNEKKIYSNASLIFSKYISNYGVGILESVIGSYKEKATDKKSKNVNRVVFQLKGTEEELTFYIVNDTSVYEEKEFKKLYPGVVINFRNIGTKP